MPPQRPQPGSTALRNCYVTTTDLTCDEEATVRRAVQAASGVYTAALTSDVTHVVAKSAGSEKHRRVCCPPYLSRVAVVGLAWVAELRGYEGTEPPSTTPYLLPPLTGFLICTTGFTDRALLERLIQKSGASLSKSLNLSCSHLIAAKPDGKKFQFALKRPIKIVSFDWLYECVEKKALLSEADFPVAGAPHRPLSNSDLPSAANTSAAFGMTLSGVTGTTTADVDRMGASAGETVLPSAEQPTPCEELAHIKPSFALESCCVYVVPCVQDNDPTIRHRRARIMRLAALSSAMVAPRWSPAVTHAVVVSVPIASAQVAAMRQALARGVSVVDADWMQHSTSAGSMLAVADYPPPSWATAATSSAFLDNSSAAVVQLTRDNASTLGGRHSRGGSGLGPPIFQGVRLALGPLAMHFPDLCSELSSVVLAGRGKVLTHDGTGQVAGGVPTHVLCPMGLSPGERAVVTAMRESNAHVELVTQIWVEECVAENRLLSAANCALFAAREYELPIREFRARKVVVAISGFMTRPPNPDRNRRRDVLGALANVLGAEYSEKMKRSSCTHLIVESTSTEMSEKIKCAQKWNVSVVSELWLLACAQQGAVLAVDPYLMRFSQPSEDHGESLVLKLGGTPFVPATNAPKENTKPRQLLNRKRPADNKPPDRGTPRRKSSRHSTTDPASAEALMKQLAASLVKATDANTAVATGTASGVTENNSRGASMDDKGDLRGIRPASNGNSLDEHALRNGSDVDGALRLLREKGSGAPSFEEVDREAVAPRRSDWSLEASQSQMIFHKDLTPPPATHVEPKPIPRLRTMPSRAAKSRQ